MYVSVFGRLPAGLSHLVAARFAVYQSSGIVAYFRVTSLKGCSGKMNWEGKQEGLYIVKRSALGARSFTLGQLLNHGEAG